ncbi:hypothetical protein L9F63_002776 [Diploptera punctata]|uniref:Uncharacterized protein n=1 Tax=Diploptera punctata TaxID=6984 RepID=A0AAD7ZR85_DIPPU|nr:hypothetical protein L9F63_002776 [Diploptera punctata]
MLGYSACQTDETVLSRKLRYVLFPDLSTMGLYLAVATPLEDIDYHVSMSWSFEANYGLPSNYTQLALPFTSATRRDVTRRQLYHVIERKFHSYGLEGRECLLRTICDISASPLHHNGLLGDILHLIFMPSTSAEENLSLDYHEAETNGKNLLSCQQLYPECRTGLLDMISTWQ